MKWLLPLLVCSLFLAAPVQAEERPTVRYALVVGHNVGSARTLPLAFAEKDAGKMATLFAELANVPADHLVVLTGPDAATLRARLTEIRTALDSQAGSRTELFFYYSGHADQVGLQLGDEHLTLDELRTFLKESGADVTIAILDACHSGAIVRDKGGKRVPLLDLALGGEGRARGVAIITSSAASEKSQESDELRGSFFTHFLASGMRGDADASRDGLVTLYELYQYAYNKTRQRTYTTGRVKQHPTFDYAMTGSGEVVVSFPQSGLSRLVLPAEMAGNILLYAPATDSVLAEVDKKAGEARVLAVPAGIVEIFKRSDTALHKARVTVGEGEEVTAPAGELSEVSRNYLLEKGEGTVISLGAKAGYQVFWDSGIRERSLLPSVVGGMEIRVKDLFGRRISPFAEFLVGGAAASSQGSTGPLAQTFSTLQVGGGVVFTLLEHPLVIEMSPEVALYYASLSVRENEGTNREGANHYAMVSPSASFTVGREFARTFTVALQVKTGYLYFEDSVSDYDREPQHLGFSEMFLTATLKL